MEIIRNERIDPNNKDNMNVFTVNSSDIVNDLYVPRYYWDKRVKDIEEEAKKQDISFVKLETLIDE